MKKVIIGTAKAVSLDDQIAWLRRKIELYGLERNTALLHIGGIGGREHVESIEKEIAAACALLNLATTARALVEPFNGDIYTTNPVIATRRLTAAQYRVGQDHNSPISREVPHD